jgi:hypothetical protein
MRSDLIVPFAWLFLFPIAGGLLAMIIPWMFGRIIDFVREMLGL